MEEEFGHRELSETEKECLLFVLPENKPGYLHYRNLIDKYSVIGKSSGPGTSIFLGSKDCEYDNDLPPSPLFALGSIVRRDSITDVLIYQLCEEIIEAEINISNIKLNAGKSLKSWSYSEWVPGQQSPEDGTEIKEVNLSGGNYTFAIAPYTRRIWLHEKVSGVNHIIPVTNYYNELMRYRNIRDPKIALNPNSLFTNLDRFSDEDYSGALIMYDKYLNRFSLKQTENNSNEDETKNTLSSFFRRKKN